MLAWLAGQTERIKLGSAIFQMPARSPAMTAMTAATLDHLSDGRVLLGIGSSGPQVAEGWHGQRFANQLDRTREYVEIVRKALARERLEYDGEQYTLPLPDGPGKALKLMIGPVQERIPIYIAAIGPKNMQLTGEIADGWIPIFFSPEHVGESRELLEEGAARAGRDLNGSFDIAPSVSVCIDDDVDRARDSVRHLLALYVGGMGSRDKNFYNALVRRYGFEEAAQTVQDLYLDGKKDEAAAALPAELIDTVAIVGPRDKVRERLAVYRDAGVGTLIVRPWPPTPSGRKQMVREHRGDALSEPAPRRRLLIAAFGDPGHAFPAIALGRELVARGHEVWLETWVALARARGARGDALRAAPEYRPARDGQAALLGSTRRRCAPCRPTRELVREVDPHAVVVDILTVAASLAAQAEERPWATLVPHVLPGGRGRGCRPTRWAPCRPRTRVGRAALGHARPLLAAGEERGRRELNGARERVGLPPLDHAHGGISRRLALVATFPQLEYPRRGRARRGARDRPAPVGAAVRRGGAAARATTRSCWWRPSTAQDPEHELLRAALEGLAGRAGAGARHVEPPPARRAASRAAQRTARGVGLLRAHDAPLRRRDLPRRPRHGGPLAGLRRARDRLPLRGRPGRERRPAPLVGPRRVAAPALPERPRGAAGGAAPAGRAQPTRGGPGRCAPGARSIPARRAPPRRWRRSRRRSGR